MTKEELIAILSDLPAGTEMRLEIDYDECGVYTVAVSEDGTLMANEWIEDI